MTTKKRVNYELVMRIHDDNLLLLGTIDYAIKVLVDSEPTD
jgi:hypothetical protein